MTTPKLINGWHQFTASVDRLPPGHSLVNAFDKPMTTDTPGLSPDRSPTAQSIYDDPDLEGWLSKKVADKFKREADKCPVMNLTCERQVASGDGWITASGSSWFNVLQNGDAILIERPDGKDSVKRVVRYVSLDHLKDEATLFIDDWSANGPGEGVKKPRGALTYPSSDNLKQGMPIGSLSREEWLLVARYEIEKMGLGRREQVGSKPEAVLPLTRGPMGMLAVNAATSPAGDKFDRPAAYLSPKNCSTLTLDEAQSLPDVDFSHLKVGDPVAVRLANGDVAKRCISAISGWVDGEGADQITTYILLKALDPDTP